MLWALILKFLIIPIRDEVSSACVWHGLCVPKANQNARNPTVEAFPVLIIFFFLSCFTMLIEAQVSHVLYTIPLCLRCHSVHLEICV